MRVKRWLKAVGRAGAGLVAAVGLAYCLAASSVVARQTGWVMERAGQSSADLNSVYFLDSKRGWIGGDGGLVLRTEDGGRGWTRQLIGTRESINDLYFRDKTDGYLLAGNQIYVTEDGGATWRAATRFSPSDVRGGVPELYSVRFPSKKKGWVVGSISRRDRVVDSLVLYTDDGGQSWQRRPVPVRDELIHLDFDGDKRGWIVGARGTILHTRDGGQTWMRQTSNTDATLHHVDFKDDDKGWAVGARGTILRTRDGGKTWAVSQSPVQATLLSVKFVNDDDGWIAGRGGIILRSGDGGRTWVRQESNTSKNLYALYLDKKFGWAVGGDGTILRYER